MSLAGFFLRIFEAVGGFGIDIYRSWAETLAFTSRCLIHMLLPTSYNPAMRGVLVRQIYFTAVQILPMFILIGILFGSSIVGFVVTQAISFSLQDQIGDILIGIVVNEFAPLFTVLLLALRTGAAVNTEIAVMKVNSELESLRAYQIDIVNYLFLPRILAGIVSVVLLSSIFAVIMLASGYLFSWFLMQMELHIYLYTLVNSVSVEDIVFFFIKTAIFGFFVMMVPISSGLQTGQTLTAIPISVLRGMVKLFVAIFTVEVITLVLRLL